MATAADLVNDAKKYLNVTEAPPGSNKQPFAPKAGHLNGYAWCASFVVACAREVGIKLPSESAWTPSLADGFKRAGRWSTKPKPGYIGFVDFPGDNTTRIQHVVIVDEPGAAYVKTIEGNTSAGTKGSQDNGGGVYTRYRPYDIFVGFGEPAFTGEPATLGNGIILPEQEHTMASVIQRPQGGYYVVQFDGGVFAYDGAPFFGSVPSNPKIKLGGNVIGGAVTETGQGYWLLARDGAVYGFGDAAYYGGFNAEPETVRGGRFAVGLLRTSPQSYRIITFDPSGDATRFDPYDYKKKG